MFFFERRSGEVQYGLAKSTTKEEGDEKKEKREKIWRYGIKKGRDEEKI